MVGQPRKKTALEVAGANARAALAKAREAHDKTPNANTKAALDAAKTKANDATKAENRERFVKVGGARVANAIAKLNALAKVANRRSYEFTENDIKLMHDAINAEVVGMNQTFIDSLKTGPKAAPVKKTFSFN